MRMNIGIGKFYCFQKRNPQPATFFENHFFNVGGVGEGMEKAGSLFGVGLPLLCLVVYFSITIYTLCIRIPSKYGTSNSNGISRLNQGDLLTTTLYIPSGIAVLCIIFCSLGKSLIGSSRVLQNTLSSIYNLPIVYSGVCAILYRNNFIYLWYY